MNKENFKRTISLIIALIGFSAIIFSIDFAKINTSELLVKIKDIAEALIGIITLLIALKISRQFSYGDFKSKFQNYLNDWIKHNRYIIDENKKYAGKNETKEFYYMLSKPNHANLVTKEKPASEFSDKGGQINPKGAFLYTDPSEKKEIVFGINQSFFKDKAGSELKFSLEEIAKLLSTRILDEYKESLNITTTISRDSRRIIVSLSEMKRTEENAKKLIDLIEFVKGMILAIA